MDKLHFFVNEIRVTSESIEGLADSWSLASFLRNGLNLTGTKVSCGVGGCGACTVLISRYNPDTKSISHSTVNCCMTPLYSLHGCHVLTVEGLSDSRSYHEIQEKLALGNATQCGFCSPGVVMSMFGLQAESSGSNSETTMSKVKTALQGNLCRCTGYRPILEAFYKRSQCDTNCEKATDGCCQGKSQDIEDVGILSKPSPICIEGLRKVNSVSRKDGVLQRIESMLIQEYVASNAPLHEFTTSSKSSWMVPTTRAGLISALKSGSNFKIVSGATSDEFWKSIAGNPKQAVIDVTKVQEMKTVELTENYLKLGASLTISEMQKELTTLISKLPDTKTKIFKAMLQMIDVYASGQVRRSATIGGSLVVTSGASDMQTAFNGFDIVANFVADNELPANVLESIQIPISENVEHAWYGKIRRRKDFDLALVNMAFKGTRVDKNTIEFTVCFGGTLLQRFTFRKRINDTHGNMTAIPAEFITNAKQKLIEHISAEQLKMNPSIESFVETAATSLFQKCTLSMTKAADDSPRVEKFSKLFRSTRILTKPLDSQPGHNLVHREVPHASAIKHVTGEAKYCDDVPKSKNELELAFVHSSKPHAKIVKIDFSEALKVDGVIGTVTEEDILPGKNKFGLVEQDEEIFASKTVTCHGQIIAGVVATSRSVATRAAKLVRVEYEDLQPVVLTMEDSIKHNYFFDKYDLKLTKGDCETVFEKGYNIITDEVKVGSQEHFYMEPQGCIVIPTGEDQELEIISSTQNPTGVQMQVANVLNIPANRITVKVKRVGGGFGGKESRCIMLALPAAIAAQKFGRPVRCILTRETDMMITGKRATYLTRHKMAFDNDGRLLALQIHVYIGAGNTIDVSMAEIERVALNIDNAYNIPNLDFRGYVCKSNHASNTVMRGTGGPQAAFLIENIVDTIATYLGKEPSQVRSLQIYEDDDFTPYGQSLKDCTVLKCWNECLTSSSYLKKREEVETFNRDNAYVKRGISINPSNYGIGYTAVHLNQGAALVHIYTDGTVLISHSGVEIGQGVNTKMIQIATGVLGIPGEKVRIIETATDKVPNTTPSSASMTTDLNGGAVSNACEILIKRLQPYKEQNPELSWEEIVNKAYMDRVSLSATGFYKVPEMGSDYDPAAVHGNPWSYFTSGAACTVVELDCLTGQFQILSTDIVMDVGKSLNPSIDVGQIEGAYMQGVGLFLLEELVYDESGKLITAGPLTYKIPTANDTPLEFNVSFLLGPGNPKAVYSSKAIGEPPILLATSAFFAVKDAIRAFRRANGKDVNFRLDTPATVEKILLACHTIFEA